MLSLHGVHLYVQFMVELKGWLFPVKPLSLLRQVTGGAKGPGI